MSEYPKVSRWSVPRIFLTFFAFLVVLDILLYISGYQVNIWKQGVVYRMDYDLVERLTKYDKRDGSESFKTECLYYNGGWLREVTIFGSENASCPIVIRNRSDVPHLVPRVAKFGDSALIRVSAGRSHQGASGAPYISASSSNAGSR
jgi:hypothetical protein